MKYCSICGNKLNDQDIFCSKCGTKHEDDAYSYQVRQYQVKDSSSFGYAILGFLIPIVGLILYLVWMNEYPLRAKSCGKGALINIIIGAVILFCMIIFINPFILY